jgi:hypothetical protein
VVIIAALMPVRNEGWCLGYTLRAALRWCDVAVVLEHACTDDTSKVLDEIGATVGDRRLIRMVESAPAWDEATYRQRLLVAARALGASHLAMIDADEAVTANIDLREAAREMRPGDCLRFPWLCVWRSMERFRNDFTSFGRARVPMLVADTPGLEHKVKEGGYQLHGRIPEYVTYIDRLGRQEGGVLHLQHLEWDRVLSKQLLYQMTETLRWGQIRANYAGTVDETGIGYAVVPRTWWHVDLLPHIKKGVVPWQIKEVNDLLQKYGLERFMECTLLEPACDAGLVQMR